MEFIIENDYLRATITESGAQIKSIIRKCDGVEHIWSGDPSLWKFQTPVMFPYAGKVKDGRIEVRGRVLENAPQHGFARLKDHKMVEHAADHVTLELTDDEQTQSLFPYSFRLLSTFRLEGDCMLHTLTVENTDNESFSFGIGYHPGFAIPFDDKHVVEDYEFRFSHMESPLCLESPTGLINGRYYSLGNNIRSIPITDGMFDNDSHCMVNLRSKTLGVYEKGSGRGVECTIDNFPYCLIWSQPGRPKFVCIEPWHSLPSHEEDSCDWEQKAAAARIAPGESWSTTMKTAFLR